MKIIEPNVQEITDFEGVDNFYKAVARAARICYANYNRITKLHKEGTYKCTDNWYSNGEIIAVRGKSYEVKKVNNDFVLIGENGHNAHNFNTQCFESWFFKYFENPDDKALVERLIKQNHFSPFEHAIIYIPYNNDIVLWKMGIEQYQGHENKYLVFYSNSKQKFAGYAINGRVIVESLLKKIDANDIIPNLDSILAYTKNYEINNTCFGKTSFKSFIVDTSIGCTREMNRHHDNFYIVEQSTRYVNFSKDKFGNEVAFNEPYWYDDNLNIQQGWYKIMRDAELAYLNLINAKIPTDIARGVLPLDTHTRAIYTATIEEWNHIIDLRLKGTTGKPHGDIKIIAEKINQIINK